MALSQPGPQEPEEPSPHTRQQPQVRGSGDRRGREGRGLRWEGTREELGCEGEVSSGAGGVQGPAVPGVPPRVPADCRSPPQECPPSDPADCRSPPQECSSSDPAEPRSPPQELPPSDSAEPLSPPQEFPPSDPTEPRSPPQEFPRSDPTEPRSPPQELPPSDPTEPRSPPQELPPSGSAEPRSPPQELPPSDPTEPRSPPRELPPSDPTEPRSPPRELPPSDPTEPRSPPQELPPSDPTEPRSPPRELPPGRQLRVLLTPLPEAAWPRAQKRLPSPRGPASKRPCPEAESGPRAAPGSAAGPSSDARGQDGLWDDGDSHLSAYERKRLKNITENAKFFAALKLHEVCIGSKCTEMHIYTLQKLPMSSQPQVPAGPLPMVPEDEAEKLGVSGPPPSLINVLVRGSFWLCRYQESLSSMVLSEGNVRKVVKARVCSMAIHPSQSTILVAAGDKLGHVGLWNSSRSEEGAHTFTPHSFHVSCMHFSPCNPAHLLSLSNDTLRCADVTRAVFDEVRSEEDFSCFDFLEENACTAIVSCWDGAVAVVDRRTPGVSPELSADIGFRRTRTVHVHPLNKHYFLAAGLVDVCVFDVRYLKAKGNKPLSSLKGHTKSVASAYFSPGTGSRVVTVCADDKLRVYDTTSLSSSVTLLSSIRHNNNTGRWLTRFRAIWDPKQEHCFLVGSMAQPRQIQVFQDTGTLLHSFCSEDYLTSVCSINVVHPSQNILVGGNSSGRLHVSC
uniref:WD repeat-containing protein 76 n=1 Tax=Catharus ustulatus TaxID=91951 RepID=A0A8C3V3E1_CATUS